jgi:hypothetical protein
VCALARPRQHLPAVWPPLADNGVRVASREPRHDAFKSAESRPLPHLHTLPPSSPYSPLRSQSQRNARTTACRERRRGACWRRCCSPAQLLTHRAPHGSTLAPALALAVHRAKVKPNRAVFSATGTMAAMLRRRGQSPSASSFPPSSSAFCLP